MKNLILLFALSFFGILFAQTEKPLETPQIAIKIPLGDTVIIENHNIKFIEVLEDSRCPDGVSCIWAGRVRIKVSYENNKGVETFQQIILGQIKGDEKNNTIIKINSDLQYDALNVSPYPQYNDDKKSLQYALLLKKKESYDR
jgi:hypothetical protein